MSLKTENSRRVAQSRPVCMGLYTLNFSDLLNSVSELAKRTCLGREFQITAPLYEKLFLRRLLFGFGGKRFRSEFRKS